MLENVTPPVFIFLPVNGIEPDSVSRAVDPICGRALADGQIAGRLRHAGRDHYFCSLECAEHFAVSARDPEMR
jgi:YHS domain-containing protein